MFAQVTQPNFWEKNSPLSSHYAAAPCDNNNNRDCLIFYLTVYVCISISAYGLFLWSRINLDQSQLVSTRDLEWNLSCLVHEMISSHFDLEGCAREQISISPSGPRWERDAPLSLSLESQNANFNCSKVQFDTFAWTIMHRSTTFLGVRTAAILHRAPLDALL